MKTTTKMKEIDGTFFHEETPEEVCNILNEYYNTGERLILDYGDITTGQSWGETSDIRGMVGRSTGEVKIPLLIKTSRSIGGVSILSHYIVQITDAKTRKTLYQHPTYKPYEEKIYMILAEPNRSRKS